MSVGRVNGMSTVSPTRFPDLLRLLFQGAIGSQLESAKPQARPGAWRCPRVRWTLFPGVHRNELAVHAGRMLLTRRPAIVPVNASHIAECPRPRSWQRRPGAYLRTEGESSCTRPVP